MPAAKSKTKQPNVVMPPATCGMCAFCHPHPDWRLLWPEVVSVHAPGVVDFRGELHEVG